MLLLFARGPLPDAPYWTGRRWLAAVDAIVWPGFAFVGLAHMSASGGIVVALAMALSVLLAARRLHTALLANHRYHFTTWRWGRTLVWMLAIGALLKVLLPSTVQPKESGLAPTNRSILASGIKVSNALF